MLEFPHISSILYIAMHSAIMGMSRQLTDGKKRRVRDTDRTIIVVLEHKTGLSRNNLELSTTMDVPIFFSHRAKGIGWRMQLPYLFGLLHVLKLNLDISKLERKVKLGH